MLLPPALGFSPHPPVSVYGTGYGINNSGFFLAAGSLTSLLYFAPHHVFPTRICQSDTSSVCTGLPFPASASYCVPTVLLYCSTGISTCCPSDTSFVLSLGPDLPRADQLYSGNLGYSVEEDSHLSLATHSGILSSMQSSSLRYCFFPHAMLLPTFRFLSFGGAFQPRTFSAQDLSTSELLRTL